MSIKIGKIISFPFRLAVVIAAYAVLAAILIILSPFIVILFIVEYLSPPRLGKLA